MVIIHGIGQGIVKGSCIQDLAQNELVLEYKLHQYNLGMTIVKIVEVVLWSIKGNLKQFIYKSEKGFIVGLFKVVDSDEASDILINNYFTVFFQNLKLELIIFYMGN